MTRVVPDQKSKFETDELFRKLSRESEVIYFVLISLGFLLSCLVSYVQITRTYFSLPFQQGLSVSRVNSKI